ncbi:unnamed protein product [Prorocentrum cordatum]|uniref:Uncharacterized protein n=1 Tax=Prorocentrum cordatum TaxID=2364126 RepID=A0ABN9RV21_9DINO|nr:unnamed protein product [Polarella glacialis]
MLLSALRASSARASPWRLPSPRKSAAARSADAASAAVVPAPHQGLRLPVQRLRQAPRVAPALRRPDRLRCGGRQLAAALGAAGGCAAATRVTQAVRRLRRPG